MGWTFKEVDRLEQARLTTAGGSGELGWRLPLTPVGWRRPHHVWVEGSQLWWRWGDEPYLETHAGPGMVEGFIGLETVDDVQVLVDPLTGQPATDDRQRQQAEKGRQEANDQLAAFAGEWGVLGLCEHQVRHDARASRFELPGPTDLHRLAPLSPAISYRHDCHEPVSAWAEIARQFRALVRIVSSLHVHKAGSREDWERLRSYFPGDSWHSPINWKAVRRGDLLPDDIEPPHTDLQWSLVAHIVNTWLRVSGLAPALSPTKTGWQITFHQQGLLGGLAGQLLVILTHADSIAVCAACGRTYPPTRKPASDRLSFCPECGRLASNRLWAQRSRAGQHHPRRPPAQTPATPST